MRRPSLAGRHHPCPVPSAGVLALTAWSPHARGELSLSRLGIGVVAVQAGIHVAMLQGHDHQAMQLSAHGSLSAVAIPPGGTPMAGMAMAGTPSWAMWLTHGAASVLVALWLRRGEAANWRAVRRVLPVLPEAFPAGPAWLPERQALDHRLFPRVLSRLVQVLGDRRRGPPLPI